MAKKSFTCYPRTALASYLHLAVAADALGQTLYDPLVVTIESHTHDDGSKYLQAKVYLRGKLVAQSAAQEVGS